MADTNLRQAIWSYNRPVLTGYYWWQETSESRPEIVELTFVTDQWIWFRNNGTGRRIPVSRLDHGRWSGPIPSPNGFDSWDQPRK